VRRADRRCTAQVKIRYDFGITEWEDVGHERIFCIGATHQAEQEGPADCASLLACKMLGYYQSAELAAQLHCESSSGGAAQQVQRETPPQQPLPQPSPPPPPPQQQQPPQSQRTIDPWLVVQTEYPCVANFQTDRCTITLAGSCDGYLSHHEALRVGRQSRSLLPQFAGWDADFYQDSEGPWDSADRIASSDHSGYTDEDTSDGAFECRHRTLEVIERRGYLVDDRATKIYRAGRVQHQERDGADSSSIRQPCHHAAHSNGVATMANNREVLIIVARVSMLRSKVAARVEQIIRAAKVAPPPPPPPPSPPPQHQHQHQHQHQPSSVADLKKRSPIKVDEFGASGCRQMTATRIAAAAAAAADCVRGSGDSSSRRLRRRRGSSAAPAPTPAGGGADTTGRRRRRRVRRRPNSFDPAAAAAAPQHTSGGSGRRSRQPMRQRAAAAAADAAAPLLKKLCTHCGATDFEIERGKTAASEHRHSAGAGGVHRHRPSLEAPEA
jgi:hypothetical protein